MSRSNSYIYYLYIFLWKKKVCWTFISSVWHEKNEKKQQLDVTAPYRYEEGQSWTTPSWIACHGFSLSFSLLSFLLHFLGNSFLFRRCCRRLSLRCRRFKFRVSFLFYFRRIFLFHFVVFFLFFALRNGEPLRPSFRRWPSLTEFYWVFLEFDEVDCGFSGFFRGLTGFDWVWLGLTGFDWVLLCFARFNRALLGFT